jgi:ACS family allantoate permease-like MFS transporter
MYTAQFYQKKEQGTRTGIWFSFNGLGGVAGAFIAYGLSQADEAGKLALPGWQVIFLLLGGVTVGLGALIILFMPDSLAKARFLNERESEVAAHRIIKNRQKHSHTFNPAHAWEAVRHYQVSDDQSSG